MAHDSNRDYRNLNKTILQFFYFLLLLLLITFWCLCLLFFLTFFDYQPIIKTSILSRLIACSHLILCCRRRRRCVLSLLRRFRVLFYRFRYKVCRFVSHFFVVRVFFYSVENNVALTTSMINISKCKQ